MCNRGVFQLRNVKLQFCDWGGSSKGVRDLLATQTLDDFLEKHQEVKFEAYVRSGSHPTFFTEYVNGWSCSIPLRNNTAEEIMKTLQVARNRFGQRSVPHSGAKVISTNKSIQGVWRPGMWGSSNLFEMEKLRELPKIPEIMMRKNRENNPLPDDEEKFREFMKVKHG